MWPLALFLLAGAGFILLYLVGSAGIIFKWLTHKHLLEDKTKHLCMKGVAITFSELNEDHRYRFPHLGNIERMHIRKEAEPDYPLLWKTESGYAVYSAAKKPKWTDTPGDLIYYMYNDEIYFVDFIPYSTEPATFYPCEYYKPKLKKYAAESNYMLLTWAMILTVAGMGFLALLASLKLL